MFTYLQFASLYAEGNWTDAFYYQPLYYTWFLGIIFKIFGPSVLAIVWVQSLIGGLTVYISGILGGRIAGKKAGVIVALFLCLYRNHILYTPYALIATLQTFLITLCLYLFYRFLQKGSAKTLILAGLTTGLSILARGNCLLVLPIMIVWIIAKYKDSKKEMLKMVSLLIISAYAVQLPFSLHNYNVKGEWTGPATAGSKVLAIGNNPQAPPGTDSGTSYIDTTDALRYWEEIANRSENPIPLKTSIINWVKEDPLSWIELKFRTLLLFFSNKESYNNTSHELTIRYAPWFKVPFITFGIVGFLFLTCLFRVRIRKFKFSRKNFLIISSLIYVASILIFYMLSRYRLPIVPVMLVLGLDCGSRLIYSIRKKPLRSNIKSLTLIVVMFLVTFFSFDFYRSNCEAWVISKINNESLSFPRNKGRIFRDSNSKLWGGYSEKIVDSEVEFHKGFKSPYLKDIGHKNAALFLDVKSLKGIADLVIEVSHRGKIFKQKFTVDDRKKINYLQLNISSYFIEEEEWFKFKIKTNNPIKISYTTQRDYWRSIDGELPLIGEWDCPLIIMDYPES